MSHRTARTQLLALVVLAVLALHADAQLCSSGVGGPLTLPSGMHTIDTDVGAIDGVPSPAFDGTAFNFTDLTIAAGATLTASGSQGLILLASGDVVIDGTIDARGQPGMIASSCATGMGGVPGPGGFAGGSGGAVGVAGSPGAGPGGGGGGVPDPAFGAGSGGGGAGHMTTGTPGGSLPGAGGAAYSGLATQVGGSGGGGGSGDDPFYSAAGAGGGGGGGYVVIVAGNTLNVSATGSIIASGGNGGTVTQSCDPFGDCAGPGGGGSGGTIDLRAGVSMPTVSGTLNVTGGMGAMGTLCGEFSGNGSAGMTSSSVQPCILPASCMVASPMGTAGETIAFPLDLQSPNSMAVDVFFEYSLDGGMTYLPCTPAPSSPLSNPALAVPLGPTAFDWDSRADSVGVAVIAVGVLMRTTVSDGVAPSPGTCTTSPFDIDNTSLCPGLCGDCDQNGIAANINDALRSAQIAVGIIVPTTAELGCCDVNASMDVSITDALMMAQSAAGLSVVLVCP